MAKFSTTHIQDPVATGLLSQYLAGVQAQASAGWSRPDFSNRLVSTPELDEATRQDILSGHQRIREVNSLEGEYQMYNLANMFQAASAQSEGSNGPPPISSQVIGEVLQATGNPCDYVIDEIRDLNYICQRIIDPLKQTVENTMSLSGGRTEGICSGIEKMCKEIQQAKESVLGGKSPEGTDVQE